MTINIGVITEFIQKSRNCLVPRKKQTNEHWQKIIKYLEDDLDEYDGISENLRHSFDIVDDCPKTKAKCREKSKSKGIDETT